MITIRQANEEDWDAIWPIFQSVIQAGDSYPYPPEMSKAEGKALWLAPKLHTFIAENQVGDVLGTYYIKANQLGLGSHVANAGYMVASNAREQGIATQMCEHSQSTALTLGYKAMQYNLVVSTNEKALRLWTKLGFATVGTLPKAFKHLALGYVDALVMYKWLD